MPDFVLVALGWSLVVLVIADVFRTVLWSGQGAGPVTGLITATGRRIMPFIPGGRKARSAFGPLVLATIAIIWAALLLVGFTLALEADPDAIRTSTTNEPVSLSERVYFVGYSLFTLGNGGLAPVTDGARAIVVAISAAGLILITLSVTYLLPVVSASVASRAFAASARSLGADPEDIVLGAWDGERIELDHQLRELSTQLGLLAEQQLAYPVLHLFQSSNPASSAPLAVADLDDVLTLLDGVDQRVAPLATPRRQLRSSIRSFLQTYGRDVHGDEAPPAPDTGRLAAAGIPLIDPSAYTLTVGELDEHRAEIRSLVHSAGGDR